MSGHAEPCALPTDGVARGAANGAAEDAPRSLGGSVGLVARDHPLVGVGLLPLVLEGTPWIIAHCKQSDARTRNLESRIMNGKRQTPARILRD